jgi:flagellin
MSIRISTNTAASQVVRGLQSSAQAEQSSQLKVASGTRILSAGDDAAGLSISEKNRAHVRSLNQGTRNAHDAVSAIQVMEGAMTETSSILIRLRELSMQAASDTVGNGERAMIDREYQGVRDELRRISGTTEFNGVSLLNQYARYFEVQTGANGSPEDDRLYIDLRNFSTEPQRLGIEDTHVFDREQARKNLALIDEAITRVSKRRAILGGLQNRFGAAIANNSVYGENLTQARSRIRDVEMAEQTSEMTRARIQNQLQTSLLSHASVDGNLALKLLG